MTQQTRTLVFVALTGDQEIRTYALDDATGALDLRATGPAHGPIGALHRHPAGAHFYGAHVGSTTLSSYRFDAASGRLTHRNTVDTGLATPALAVTDATGRYLIASYYTGGGATVHRLDDDGAIGDLVQRVDTGEKAHAVLVDPTNRFVFVPHVCPNNKTSQFRFDPQSGQLTPNDPAAVVPADPLTGPRHMCFGPGGDVVYTVNEQGNTITAHRYDARRGTLAPFQTVPTLPAGYVGVSHTAHIEVHPSGRWVYASNRGPGDSLAAFAIAADGGLRPGGHAPAPASPRSFSIDPTGRFLYCAGEGDGRLRAYRVDAATGQLTQQDEFAVGASPFWVLALRV